MLCAVSVCSVSVIVLLYGEIKSQAFLVNPGYVSLKTNKKKKNIFLLLNLTFC